MSTTTNTVGISGEERLSSRVLRPPGGASNFTLGFGSDEPSPPTAASSNKREAGGSQSSSPATGVVVSNAQQPSSPAPVAVVAPVQPVRQDSHSRLFGGGDSSGTEKDGANPITGGDAIICATGAAAMRNTSRVLQPPGGQSNITF